MSKFAYITRMGNNLKQSDDHVTKKYIVELLKDIKIPKHRILFLHLRLRNIKNIIGQTYKDTSKALLDSFWFSFQPKTILVPSFTYSFTNSGVFHRLFSKSEVGRFSEEVRQHFARWRTPDPIFSVLDVTDHLERDHHIDYKSAFGENSIFHYLNEQDCIIINFDLEEFVSTQLHYIEKVNNVPYRYNKVFYGVIYHDENKWENIQYNYFVRDLNLNPSWNRSKLEQYLTDVGALNVSVKDGIKISAISTRTMLKVLSNVISQNPNYLIE